jgi:3'-phosphoadenosine 5'-phosphosulfate (PAPS) 3'-phosphatase
MFWQEILEFAQETTEKVGSQLITDFGKLQATRKDDGSLVTKADQWSDQQIREAIARLIKQAVNQERRRELSLYKNYSQDPDFQLAFENSIMRILEATNSNIDLDNMKFGS